MVKAQCKEDFDIKKNSWQNREICLSGKERGQGNPA